MNDLENRVRVSFDALTVPPGLNARTLEAIERERAREAAASQRVQDVEIACAQAPAPQASPAERVECGPMGGEADGRRAGAAPRKRGRMVAWKRTAWALAACLALAAVGFGGYRWYAEPTAFVSLDVNPSIELEVNRFDTVVAARGVNEDGRALLESVPLVGEGYDAAMDRLTASEAFASFVSTDSYIEINIACDDEAQAQKLEAASNTCLSTLPCKGSCHAADDDEWHAAHEAGMGVGRYRAALELMACDPDVTLEECSHLSMRELRDRLDACADEETEGAFPQDEDDADGSAVDDMSGKGHRDASDDHAGRHGAGQNGQGRHGNQG